MTNDDIFSALWKQYTIDNAQAKKIYDLFTETGETVVNDHIALRTFNDPRINIEVLAKPFLKNGYQEGGKYDFPVKKLKAKHFEHKDPSLPKVFISELLTENFSASLQTIVKNCVDKIPEQYYHDESLLFSGTLWQPISYKTYQDLLSESEYAAWMYAYGFRANHFTVNVNALKNFNEISELNTFLKEHGFKLNTSGGEVKGTPEDFLEQSSTLAEHKQVEFKEGVFDIPSCYYEFAKRYPLANGQLYQGFVAASADKIFESTDRSKST